MPGLYALRPSASASKSTDINKPQKQQFQYSPAHYPPKSTRPPFIQVSPTLPLKHPQKCPQPIRLKKVTDPLTETVKARIYGTAMDAQTRGANYVRNNNDHDLSSTCLAAMVHEFMEDGMDASTCGRAGCNCVNGAWSGEGGKRDQVDEDEKSVAEQSMEILEEITSSRTTTELLFLADVSEAVKVVKEELSLCNLERLNCIDGCSRRHIMSHLRCAGYNAGICKCKWDHTDNLPAGNHEYIDIVMDRKDGKRERLILDMDFKAQFKIARATTLYDSYLNVLPNIFLGTPEKLQQLLKIMSEAVKCSFKKKGLHVPPWRKLSYMQAKWFSPYKRTSNEEPRDPATSNESLQREPSSTALKVSQFCFSCTFYEETVSGKQEAIGRHGKEFVVVAGRSNETTSNSMTQMKLMSDDWQLPAMEERHGKRRHLVSGIAGALKV